MFQFLALVLFIGLFVLIIGITLLLKILTLVFRSGKAMRKNNYKTKTGYKSKVRQTNVDDNPERYHAKTRKKIFEDNEGEYVEFEEIKD